MTVHAMKINSALACVRENLSHVSPRGAAVYASRSEAIGAAMRTIRECEQYDSSQIAEIEGRANDLDS